MSKVEASLVYRWNIWREIVYKTREEEWQESLKMLDDILNSI